MGKKLVGVALAIVAGLVLVAPHLWSAYERATAPMPPPPPENRYDPDLSSRSIAYLIATCRPANDPYDVLGLGSVCLSTFAERRQDAATVVPRLLEFTRSANGIEVAEAITILGWFDHRAATPDIVAHLSSTDWRVALAASRTLGWLGATEALAELDLTADSHWLPIVRSAAAKSAAAIRTSGKLAPPTVLRAENGGDDFWHYLRFDRAGDAPTCPGDAYNWQGRRIEWSPRRDMLVLPDGRLRGYDRGEWGGALVWRPWLARATVIHGVNVNTMARDSRDVVAIFGVAHIVPYGYVARISRDSAGGWRMASPIHLPGQVYGLAKIAPGIFATHSDAGVVVFDRDRVLGLASCGTVQTPR